MFFQKSDATILWMNFFLKTSKKQFLLKNWSFCCIHAIILWTELKYIFSEDYNFSSNLQPLEKGKVWISNQKLETRRVEVPERMSATAHFQRLVIFESWFRGQEEHHNCYRADQLWFSLNQGCLELEKSWLISRVLERIHFKLALIFLALKHWVFSAAQRALFYPASTLIFTRVRSDESARSGH